MMHAESMEPLAEIKKEVDSIMCNCTKLMRHRASPQDAADKIMTAAERMEDELNKATTAMKLLRKKNTSLAQENFKVTKEQKELRTQLKEKENKVKEVWDELNASQRSLFECGDTEEVEKDTPKD